MCYSPIDDYLTKQDIENEFFMQREHEEEVFRCMDIYHCNYNKAEKILNRKYRKLSKKHKRKLHRGYRRRDELLDCIFNNELF